MLDCVRQTLRDVCWLCDSQHKIALRPTGWSARPTERGLSFYAPRFNLYESQTPWLVGDEISLPEFTTGEAPSLIEHIGADRTRFTAVHAEILSAIAAGRLIKVVPFVREAWVFQQSFAYPFVPKVFTPEPYHYAFGFHYEDEGLAGHTPEVLFRVHNGFLTTMALAGTGKNDGPSLLTNKKERHEHDLVIEHIVSVLSDLGTVEVGVTEEKNYLRLKHLHTPISLPLSSEPDFINLVERLHPTAALGGYPRHEALEFLRAHGDERGRFGAPFGFKREGEMLCLVGIRALQWEAARAWLMVGCGVVEGSDAESEWQELKLKRESTARGLGLSWI